MKKTKLRRANEIWTRIKDLEFILTKELNEVKNIVYMGFYDNRYKVPKDMYNRHMQEIRGYFESEKEVAEKELKEL